MKDLKINLRKLNNLKKFYKMVDFYYDAFNQNKLFLI